MPRGKRTIKVKITDEEKQKAAKQVLALGAKIQKLEKDKEKWLAQLSEDKKAYFATYRKELLQLQQQVVERSLESATGYKMEPAQPELPPGGNSK